jgi:hypothetical protein
MQAGFPMWTEIFAATYANGERDDCMLFDLEILKKQEPAPEILHNLARSIATLNCQDLILLQVIETRSKVIG